MPVDVSLRDPNCAVARLLIAFLLSTALGQIQLSKAADLDPQILAQIDANTFEVVAAKPIADNLTYVRPLPLELLPFQERNDKFHSIGTAVSIGNGSYITAAHVLSIGIGGLWGSPAIRDSKGHEYPIDKIQKFSLPRDFAVFSVIGHPDSSPLKTNINPELNTPVYAVGNALGTGVVIRDGLYTSRTPEEQDGRWNWIRFSAAASPGNSGGPLLDKSGAIIGIVLRKSENENLNYALPIGEVLQAPDRQADIDNRAAYRLDVLDTVQNGTFKGQFSLPLNFGEFSAAFMKLANAFSDSQLKALLSQQQKGIFPNGEGSNRLLHNVSRMHAFPALITRKSDGEWTISEPKNSKTPLAANGYVLEGIFGREILFRFRKPDDMPDVSLYSDSEELMKQLLKTGFMQRPVAGDKIQITDLGKPTEESSHIDAWQRHWQVRLWPLPFINAMFVTLSLPVPDGYVTIARYSPAGGSHKDTEDLKALADFVCSGYWGTLAQWKGFLKNAALLPPALKTVKVEYQYDHTLSFESDRVSISFTHELQDIGKESMLGVGFNYLDKDGKPNLGIGDVRVQRNAEEYGDWINIQRHIAPSQDLDDSYKSTWDKIVQRIHPFDGISHTEGDGTRISQTIGQPEAAAHVLYTALVGVNGNTPQEAMKVKLDSLLKSVRVGDH